MESESYEESATTSGIPRGGPIYLPRTIGNHSTIPEFQSSFLNLLQDLETHLSPESLSSSQQFDVSTDALKIYTDEELTDMAMKEALKDDDNCSQNELEQSLIVSNTENPPAKRATKAKRKKTVEKTVDDNCSQNELEQSLIDPENPPARRATKAKRKRTVEKTVDNCSQSELEQSLIVSNPENPPARRVKRAKRKRTVEEKTKDDNCSQNERGQALIVSQPENPPARRVTKAKRKRTVGEKTVEPYIAKVEQLAKIQQKQEEDKATVRLHCFSKTCENIKDIAASQEGPEQMQSLKYIDNYTHVKPSDIQGQVDPLFPEVILCVEIYNSRKSKTQEFLVLGRQMLSELKDKIHCVTDQSMKKAGTYDHSGYFLIEDVFYNDLRNPSAKDYSKPILDWLWNTTDEAFEKWEHVLTGGSQQQRKQKSVLGQAKSKDLPRYESADMHMTRFCDLKFKIGADYHYFHQGDCKHTIVIRDMRLIHPDDVQSRAAYPRLVYRTRPRIQKCSVCNIYRATKVALDVEWSKENPCYLCVRCRMLLHFWEEEEEDLLDSHFSVFDYLHD